MVRKLLLSILFSPLICFAQSAGPTTYTITGTGCTAPFDVSSSGVVGISVANTATGSAWTGTLQPEIIIGNDAPTNVQVTPYTGTTAQSTITANGMYRAGVSGANYFLLCGNTVTNKVQITVTGVKLASSLGGGGVPAGSAIPTLVQSGLMAQYDFNQGSGTTLTDISGNNNNGTLCAGGQAPTWIAPTSGGGLTFNAASTQCATVPAALNSALTVMVYIGHQNSDNSGSLAAPLIGNGAPATSTSLILDSTSTFLGNPTKGANRLVVDSNQTAKVTGWFSFNGTGDLALTFDTLDHLYVNGKEYSGAYNVQGAPAIQSSGQYQFGGAAAGQGLGAASWYTGNIYYAAFWNRVLTPQEIYQSHLAMAQLYLQRGGFLPNPNIYVGGTDNKDEMLAIGDSITFNLGPMVPGLVLNGTWNVDNQGKASMVIGNYTALSLALTLDQWSLPYYHINAARNAAIVWAGTNDIGLQSKTPAQTFGYLESFCKVLRGYGFKVFVVTMISRTAQDANKNAYDALIRSYWPTFADSLIDMAANVNLGADGASANTTYFQVDAVHPTTNSNDNIILPTYQAAVNRFYGNTNFSTAATYTTGAAAATATTSLTESTNTVTATFAATPCVAGQMCTIAGVTPAGYNGTWFVLTSNATTITYFNPTTGLGAATVQGTGTTPLQKDADQYVILAGSATSPSFTLETCVGYTGQNLYLKNANTTSPWVITPFGSETIDGAASLTMPTATSGNNPVVVLQSQLISSSAAGCNWKRLQ